MAQARGDKEYILPVKGYNSEANLLHFPQEFSPDCLNMEVDYDPQVVRPRKGVSVSGTAVASVESRTAGDHDVGINTYLWESVGGDPELNYVVAQVGRYLYLFNDTGTDNASTAAHGSRLDLNNVLSGTTEGTLALLEPTRCDFATIKGNLIVCNNAIEPSIVQYNAGTGAFTLASLVLQMRDLFGIDDGLEVAERPSTATGLSDDHKYNLYNQGWYKQRRIVSAGAYVDPIAQFETIHGEYPSNADIAHLGMVDSSGDLIFDPEWLKDQTFGGSPAPKGHFIVDVFNIDRATLLASPQTGTGGSGGGAGGGLNDSWNDYTEDPF